MYKELYSSYKVSNALDTQAITSDTTTNGDIIDTAEYGSLLFVIQSGTLTDGTYTVLIHEGDESNLSDASAVDDADLTNTEASASFASTDDNTVTKIGYVGSKRYVRLSLVSASTSSGGTLGAIAIQGSPITAPVQ